jgi:hypothetical protein
VGQGGGPPRRACDLLKSRARRIPRTHRTTAPPAQSPRSIQASILQNTTQQNSRPPFTTCLSPSPFSKGRTFLLLNYDIPNCESFRRLRLTYSLILFFFSCCCFLFSFFFNATPPCTYYFFSGSHTTDSPIGTGYSRLVAGPACRSSPVFPLPPFRSTTARGRSHVKRCILTGLVKLESIPR